MYKTRTSLFKNFVVITFILIKFIVNISKLAANTLIKFIVFVMESDPENNDYAKRYTDASNEIDLIRWNNEANRS